MSEIPFLNSITYQVIVDGLIVILLYCVSRMLCSSRGYVRDWGFLFLIPLMLAACTFNAMMIMGRCEVVNEKVSMTDAIRSFKKARKEFIFREIELNNAVQPHLESLIEKKDIPGLNDLVDKMPFGYKGSRRMYEAMEIIVEEKKQNDKKR